MEYLIIMGLVLFITIPSVLIYTIQSESVKEEVLMNQAQVAIQKIVDSAEDIYYLGPPSRDTVKIYFPERIENITILSNEIILIIGSKEIYVFSEVPLNGSILITPGIHEISLTAKSSVTNYVQVEGK